MWEFLGPPGLRGGRRSTRRFSEYKFLKDSSKSEPWEAHSWRKRVFCFLFFHLVFPMLEGVSSIVWRPSKTIVGSCDFFKTYFCHQSGRHWPDLDDTSGFESWPPGPHFGPIPGPWGGPKSPEKKRKHFLENPKVFSRIRLCLIRVLTYKDNQMLLPPPGPVAPGGPV